MGNLKSGILAFMVLCMLMTLPVCAKEQTGSVQVDIKAYATDEAVGGGSLKLFLVAEADGYTFVYTEAFRGQSEDLLTQEGLEKAGTAGIFEEWAADQGIPADAYAQVDENGHARFEGLSMGLYLITQDVSADGYEAVNAFLVTVPFNENGTWIYDLDATPKTAPVRKVETPTPTPKPEEPVVEKGPVPGPKTGDAAALGLALVLCAAAGTCIYACRKKGEQI